MQKYLVGTCIFCIFVYEKKRITYKYFVCSCFSVGTFCFCFLPFMVFIGIQIIGKTKSWKNTPFFRTNETYSTCQHVADF